MVVLLVGAGWAVFRTVVRLPGAAIARGQELLRGLTTVAAAFYQGTAETTFLGYASGVSGSSYLQFATLTETEIFSRTDSASVMWGALALPDVVVEARAPVETTYYVDLRGAWDFSLDGAILSVTAPPIRFNRPSIDVSRLEIDVRQGSILRDEETVQQRLREALTTLAAARARQRIPLIRDTGRREIASFVETWLARTFLDGETVRVEVRFADEGPDPGLLIPPDGRR